MMVNIITHTPHLAGGLQVHAQEQSPLGLCLRACVRARAALLAEFFASHLPPGLPLLVSSLKVAWLKADVPLLSYSPTASAQSLPALQRADDTQSEL